MFLKSTELRHLYVSRCRTVSRASEVPIIPVLFDPGKDDRRSRSLWASLDDARLSESVARAHVYFCPYLGICGQVIICVKNGSAVHISQVLMYLHCWGYCTKLQECYVSKSKAKCPGWSMLCSRVRQSEGSTTIASIIFTTRSQGPENPRLQPDPLPTAQPTSLQRTKPRLRVQLTERPYLQNSNCHP